MSLNVRLLLGFMLPTWFLSLWINNTSTAALMLPMVLSVITEHEKTDSATLNEGHTNDAITMDEEGRPPGIPASVNDVELVHFQRKGDPEK